MGEDQALIGRARERFHRQLLLTGVLDRAGERPTNADKASAASKQIAELMLDSICSETGTNVQNLGIKGQTSGAKFEVAVHDFLVGTFPKLQHIRPGEWEIIQLGNNSATKIWDFAQYEHLAYLQTLMDSESQLETIMGRDYLVAPDVVIYRRPVEESVLNAPFEVADDDVATRTELRARNGGKNILHASVSVKWTMRSDRAQNSRTEALNLIRNRNGRLPHIVVVTGEPLPSRLASLALGTGDIDCVYHFALDELISAVEQDGDEDRYDQLMSLVNGRRLKDISDLPLDLSI